MDSYSLSWDEMQQFFSELEAAEAKATQRYSLPPKRAGQGLGYVGSILADEIQRVAEAPGGTRHTTLISAASNLGSLVAGGELDEDQTRNSLFAAAKGNQDGPFWSDHDILRTIRDGFDYGQENPRTAPKDDAAAPAAGAAVDEDGLTAKDRILNALVTPSGLDGIPDPLPVIKGLLYMDSMAWLFGGANQGKSFVAIDMATAIAEGREWMGRRVSQGPVVYLVGEGLSGIKFRRRAWETHHGRAMPENMRFLPMAVQASSAEWSGLIEAMEEIKPALVILDTQQMITEGMDENSSVDMGILVGQLNRLRIASGACVMTVHHIGVSGRIRGFTGVPGAATTTIQVSQEGDIVEVEVVKQKDGPKPKLALRLVVVEIGRDSDGEPITSCVVVDASDDSMDEVARYAAWMDSTEVQEIIERWKARLGVRDVTATELAEVIDTPRATIDKLLHGLLMRDIVRQSGTGAQKRYAMIKRV